MNDLHWDGKMDYGWEDLSELINSLNNYRM